MFTAFTLLRARAYLPAAPFLHTFNTLFKTSTNFSYALHTRVLPLTRVQRPLVLCDGCCFQHDHSVQPSLPQFYMRVLRATFHAFSRVQRLPTHRNKFFAVVTWSSLPCQAVGWFGFPLYCPCLSYLWHGMRMRTPDGTGRATRFTPPLPV